MNKIHVTSGELISFLKPIAYTTKKMDLKLQNFKPISTASYNEITFCNQFDQNSIDLINQSTASIIIVSKKLMDSLSTKENLIFVENPRLSFIQCMNHFLCANPSFGIHPTSIIESDITTEKISIGPFVYVEQNVFLGEFSKIDGHSYIYQNTTIGKNVHIDASTIIGPSGTGLEKNNLGTWEKFPQLGGVIIEDDVQIGSNCSVMRGTFDNTIIKKGTVIGHLVNIGHNVLIESDCFVASGTKILGSAVLKTGSYVGVNSTILNKIIIGENSIVGAGSVVTQNVPKNKVVAGNPAKIIRDNKPQ